MIVLMLVKHKYKSVQITETLSGTRALEREASVLCSFYSSGVIKDALRGQTSVNKDNTYLSSIQSVIYAVAKHMYTFNELPNLVVSNTLQTNSFVVRTRLYE